MMTTAGRVNRNGRGVTLALFIMVPLCVIPRFAVAQENPIRLVRTARDYLISAQQQYDNDELNHAIETARRALEQNGRFADAHLLLAEAFMWQSAYDLAAEHLSTAKALGSDDVEVSLLEGQLAVLDGRFSDAQTHFDAVLREQPYNEDAQIARTLLHITSGQFQPTERQLMRLEQRYPQNRRLLLALVEINRQRGDDVAVRRYLDLALRYHNDSAEVQLLAAQFALRQGDIQSAEFHGRNAVSIAPGLNEAWLLLAETARQRGRNEEAINHYQTLITMNPEDHRAWYARGVVAAEEGDRTIAFQSWDRALSLRPDFELALLAKEHFAMDRLPLESDIRKDLAQRYIRTGSELEDRFLFRQAEQSYRRGLQLYPFHKELRVRLAELYRDRGMRGRYVQELRVIQELGNGDEDIREILESYDSLLQDSLAARWNIDQFTVERPRTGVFILYRSAQGVTEPNAAEETAAYLRSILLSSQNIEITGMDRWTGESRAVNFATARRDGGEMVVAINVTMENRRIGIHYELLPQSGVVPILEDVVYRSGNNRVRDAVREIARKVDERIPVQGYVLDRRITNVLIGIGGVDGVEQGDLVEVMTTPDGRSLGTTEIQEVDDLIAVISWNPDGPDLLGIGDRVVYIPPQDGEDEPVEPAEQPPVPDLSPDTVGMLQRLFRLPQRAD